MMMTPTRHEKLEWARFAQAAYSRGRNDLGHKFSGWATLREGEPMQAWIFDDLQAVYRAWLVFGEMPARAPTKTFNPPAQA